MGVLSPAVPFAALAAGVDAAALGEVGLVFGFAVAGGALLPFVDGGGGAGGTDEHAAAVAMMRVISNLGVASELNKFSPRQKINNDR